MFPFGCITRRNVGVKKAVLAKWSILYGEQVFKAFKTQKVNTWKMNIFLNINRYVFFVNLINMQFLYSTLY